jgi:hypothetical protein
LVRVSNAMGRWTFRPMSCGAAVRSAIVSVCCCLHGKVHLW